MPGPGRPKGIPKTGGRQKGTCNKTTLEVREFARSLLETPTYKASLIARLEAGILSPAVESMLWHYAHGKPRETVELTGADGGPIELTTLSLEDARKVLLERLGKTSVE